MSELVLSATNLSVQPQSKHEVIATLKNESMLTDQYRLKIDGLPDDWFTVENNEVTLFAGESADRVLQIHPPDDALPGTYKFSVTAETSIFGDIEETIQAEITILQLPTSDPKRSGSLNLLINEERGAAATAVVVAPKSVEGPVTTVELPAIKPIVSIPPPPIITPAPTAAAPVERATPVSALPATPNTIAVTPDTVTIHPAEQQELAVTIENKSPLTDQFKLGVEGIPESWYTLQIQNYTLFAGESAETSMHLHPPAETSPGVYTFSIIATAELQQETLKSPAITLTVAGLVPESPVAEPEPPAEPEPVVQDQAEVILPVPAPVEQQASIPETTEQQMPVISPQEQQALVVTPPEQQPPAGEERKPQPPVTVAVQVPVVPVTSPLTRIETKPLWKPSKPEGRNGSGPAKPAAPKQPRLAGAIPGELTLLPPELTIQPEDRQDLVVIIRNKSLLSDLFTLRISGIPDEWYTLPEDKLILHSGDQGRIILQLHPTANALPGPHTFSITAEGSVYEIEETAHPTLIVPKAPADSRSNNEGVNYLLYDAPFKQPLPPQPETHPEEPFILQSPHHVETKPAVEPEKPVVAEAPLPAPPPTAAILPPVPAKVTQPVAAAPTPMPAPQRTYIPPEYGVDDAENENDNWSRPVAIPTRPIYNPGPVPDTGDLNAEDEPIPAIQTQPVHIPGVVLSAPVVEHTPGLASVGGQADPLVVALETNSIALHAGESGTINVKINNKGVVVDTYNLRVEGIDPSWYRLPLKGLNLFVGNSGVLPLVLKLPQQQIRGRDYYCRIGVQSSANPAIVRWLPFKLTVVPTVKFQLAMLPRRIRSTKPSRYTVTVNNLGNTNIDAKLTANDSEEACIYRFTPSEIIVPAFTRRDVQLVVEPQPKVKPYPNIPMPYSFTVTGTAPNLDNTPLIRTTNGELIYTYSPRRVPWGLIQLLLILLALFIIGSTAPRWRPWLLGNVVFQNPLPAEYANCQALRVTEEDLNNQFASLNVIGPYAKPTIRLDPPGAGASESIIASVVMTNALTSDRDVGNVTWDGNIVRYVPVQRQGWIHYILPPEEFVEGWNMRIRRDLDIQKCQVTQVRYDPGIRQIIFLSKAK